MTELPPPPLDMVVKSGTHWTSTVACNCPDWQYRGMRDRRPCKHVRRLQEALETLWEWKQGRAALDSTHVGSLNTRVKSAHVVNTLI